MLWIWSLHQCYGLVGVFHSSSSFSKVHHSERHAKWSRAGGWGLTYVTSDVLWPFEGRWAKHCAWTSWRRKRKRRRKTTTTTTTPKASRLKSFPSFKTGVLGGLAMVSLVTLRSIHGGGLWIPQANMGRVNDMKLARDVVKYHALPCLFFEVLHSWIFIHYIYTIYI